MLVQWASKGPGRVQIPFALSEVLNFRRKSLLRGNLFVLLSFFIAVRLSGFPHTRENPLLVLPTLTALLGLVDTIRCMRKRWSFYHGGVLLCVYMDLMALCMILFFLIYPYGLWLSSSH